MKLLSLVALALLCACASHSSSPVPPTAATPNHARTNSSTLLWSIGDYWEVATDGQCGTPSFGLTGSVSFSLTAGSGCIRNQLNPLKSPGTIWTLSNGTVYTWDFQTVAQMQIDSTAYANRLIWQIHQANAGSGGCALSPITSLNVLTDGNGKQSWAMFQGDTVKLVDYTEDATDTWQIVAKIAKNNSGWTKAYHNGSLFLDTTGPNYPPSCDPPFWNFGPYDWQMADPSYMGPTTVMLKVNYMNLSD